MGDGELSRTERQVVEDLMRPPGAPIADKTFDKVVERTGLRASAVRRALRRLAELDPPLVHSDVDAKLGVEFWIALPAAIDALEDDD